MTSLRDLTIASEKESSSAISSSDFVLSMPFSSVFEAEREEVSTGAEELRKASIAPPILDFFAALVADDGVAPAAA